MLTTPAIRSGDSAARVEALRHLDSLQGLPDSELLLLAQHAVLRAVEPNDVIMAEHAIARHLWLVLSGTVEQCMEDEDGSDITLAMLGRGDLFGEGGLFGVRYRRTTVRATTRAFLLQWSYATVQPHLAALAQFVGGLRIRFRERLLHTALARVPILASLTPMERLSLASQLDDERFDRHTTILTAGDMGRELCIVAEGQATVIYNDHSVAVLHPGDVFGEMSLLEHIPHEATIVSLTPVHLLKLPLPTFEHLLSQRADVALELQRLAQQRRSVDRTEGRIAITERLIRTGIVRGEMALVRQPELCDPDCDRCERACADRFGVARLRLTGDPFGDVIAADLCRHCRWGAECVESCPEDAFKMDADGHWVVTDRCTGCGACIEACPYDAINQVPVYAPSHNPLDWLMQRMGRREPLMLRANKCDACYGHDDHACVSACPTGALQWVPVESLYGRAATSSTPIADARDGRAPANRRP
jgi:CRP-like cAMP-binding protein/Fe-S-cluster-containing hydrogenase component 2